MDGWMDGWIEVQLNRQKQQGIFSDPVVHGRRKDCTNAVLMTPNPLLLKKIYSKNEEKKKMV